jgi:hypothetical protein
MRRAAAQPKSQLARFNRKSFAFGRQGMALGVNAEILDRVKNPLDPSLRLFGRSIRSPPSADRLDISVGLT